MEKLFYSISEVSEILGESVSLVRFWSNSFPRHIKPRRNAKGNRMFTADDIEALKQIHLLKKRTWKKHLLKKTKLPPLKRNPLSLQPKIRQLLKHPQAPLLMQQK